MVTFTDVETYPDNEVDVKVIDISEETSERIRKLLKIRGNKKIYKFERLRFSNNIPFFLQYTYISSDYLTEEDIKHPETFKSIYTKIKKDFDINLSISPSIENYRILFPTPHYITNLLELPNDAPTSFVERTTFKEDGSIIEYIESFKRWDYYCSKIEVS